MMVSNYNFFIWLRCLRLFFILRTGAKAAARRPSRDFSQSWRNLGRSWGGIDDLAPIRTVSNRFVHILDW